STATTPSLAAGREPGRQRVPCDRPGVIRVTEPILQARKLNKSFGPVHVLHDVDFDVYPGEVTALVGDNGAGKSTLVKCFAGINNIDSRSEEHTSELQAHLNLV